MPEKTQVVISRHPSGYWIGVAAIPLSGCSPKTASGALPMGNEVGALPIGHGDFRKNIIVYEILDERPIMKQVLREMLAKAKKQGVFVGGFFGNIWKKIKKGARKLVRKIARTGIARRLAKIAKKAAQIAKKIGKVVVPIVKAIGPTLLTVASAIPIIGPAIQATREAIESAINVAEKARAGVKETLDGIKSLAEKAALGDPRAKQALNLIKQVKRKTGKYRKAALKMKPSRGRKPKLIVPAMRRIKKPKPLPRLPRIPPEPKAPAMDAAPAAWAIYVQQVEKWEKAKKGHQKLRLKKKKYARSKKRRALVHVSVKLMSGKEIFAAL